MKTWILDLVPGLVFLAVLLASNNIYLATGAGMVVGVAQVGWMLARGQRVDPLQWTILALVVVMGGATMVFKDPRFVMIKPSLGFACVGAMMLEPGWIGRYMPEHAKGLIPPRLVVVTGYVFAGAMFSLAGANLAVALLTGQKVWAIYSVAGPTVVLSALSVGVSVTFRRVARRSLAAEGSLITAP